MAVGDVSSIFGAAGVALLDLLEMSDSGEIVEMLEESFDIAQVWWSQGLDARR
jgi:hypothetical protein